MSLSMSSVDNVPRPQTGTQPPTSASCFDNEEAHNDDEDESPNPPPIPHNRKRII